MDRLLSRRAPVAIRRAAHALAQAITARGVRKVNTRWRTLYRGLWVRFSLDAWCKAEGDTIEVDGAPVTITPAIFDKARHEVYRGRYGPAGDAFPLQRPRRRRRKFSRLNTPKTKRVFQLPVRVMRQFEREAARNRVFTSKALSAALCHFLESTRRERANLIARLDDFPQRG